jgi:hypothetical protein
MSTAKLLSWFTGPFPAPDLLPSHACGTDSAKREHLEQLLTQPGAALVRQFGLSWELLGGRSAARTQPPLTRLPCHAARRCWWTRSRLTSLLYTVRERARHTVEQTTLPAGACLAEAQPAHHRGGTEPLQPHRAAPPPPLTFSHDCPPRACGPAVSRLFEYCTGYSIMDVLGKNWCAPARQNRA